MLTAATPIETSRAYVAMERFDGTLDGRRGTFILQHLGTMTRAGQSLTITVVPDSGTGELAGLEGTLLVEITDGEHFYDFEYTLPDRTATARDPGRRPRARRPRHGSDGCRTPPRPTRDPVRRHQRDETEEAR